MTDKLIVNPVICDGKPSKYRLEAEITGDKGIYDELRVAFIDENDEVVADVYFLVDEEGNPQVLLTTDGDGLGDHRIAVNPLLPAEDAVMKLVQ